MSKRQIFTVSSCDVWKTRDSMRLMMVTTSVRRLKSFIAEKIHDDTFTYGDGSLSKSRQVWSFMADFDTIPKENINDLLSYGFLDFSYDGEEI